MTGKRQGRRLLDPTKTAMEPRNMVWDNETKAVFLSMAGETAAKATREVLAAIGVDPIVHREQHMILVEIIPWIQSQKKKADTQAEFWASLITENFRRSISWALWLLVTAAFLGLSGAWHLLTPILNKLAE